MIDYYTFSRFDLDNGERVEYRFTTSKGIEYYAYFVPAPLFIDYISSYTYLNSNSFMFGFDKLLKYEKVKKCFDERLEKTICTILMDFFKSEGNNTVLLYHCDGGDSLQRCRSILFSKWYNCNSDKDKVVKSGITIEVPELDGSTRNEYLGYITMASKDNLSTIQDEFGSIAGLFASNNK